MFQSLIGYPDFGFQEVEIVKTKIRSSTDTLEGEFPCGTKDLHEVVALKQLTVIPMPVVMLHAPGGTVNRPGLWASCCTISMCTV